MSYITLQLKSYKFGTEVYLGGGRADIVLLMKNKKQL